MQKSRLVIMKKSNRQQGFTLIEVMIAIVLLTIGILAAGTMQISSLGGNSNANRITQASTLAGGRIESIMSKPYPPDPAPADRFIALDTDIKDTNDDKFAGLDNTDTAGSPADHSVVDGDFTIFWNVAHDYPIYNCMTIRVIVRRSDKGVMKTVSADYSKMRAL